MTLIWFPNNKYHPNTKNYLPCLLLGGTFSIREKGLVLSHAHVVLRHEQKNKINGCVDVLAFNAAIARIG